MAKNKAVLKSKTYKVNKEKLKINFNENSLEIEGNRINFFKIVEKIFEILRLINNFSTWLNYIQK